MAKRRFRPAKPITRKVKGNQEVGASKVQPNSTGLPTLPVELIRIIISHIPPVPFPCLKEQSRNSAVFSRSETLLALSLSCRWLRSNVEGLLWESLNVFPRPALPNSVSPHVESKDLATELVQKLEVVTIRVPDYSLRIRSLAVHLTSYSSKTVFEEFIRGLLCMSNLETLQILSFPAIGLQNIDYVQHFVNAVSRVSSSQFPKVSYMSADSRILQVLVPCFPSTRHVHARSYHGATTTARIVGTSCANLEAYYPDLSLPNLSNRLEHFHAVCVHMPNLQAFPLPFVLELPSEGRKAVRFEQSYMPIPQLHHIDSPKGLGRLKNLRIIRFAVYGLLSRDGFPENHGTVERAKQILRARKDRPGPGSSGKFSIEITFHLPGKREMIVIDV